MQTHLNLGNQPSSDTLLPIRTRIMEPGCGVGMCGWTAVGESGKEGDCHQRDLMFLSWLKSEQGREGSKLNDI